MIGKLTIDKSSMNMSYFLYTILIIAKHNGAVSRKKFVEEMASFVGVPAVKDGKENRTAYNKSKMVRYFGFADVVIKNTNDQYLVLTNRGKLLIDYIKDNGEKIDSENRYSILPECRGDFVDLIFESVIFDSFGKNNSGAEQSNTDVEPPKVVFKTLLELGKATADEICHVLYGLNRGVYQSFDEAIEAVKQNRARDYTKLNEEWGITNIAGDCKIIDIFTDSNIQLIAEERDEETGKRYYRLSATLGEAHRKQIQQISAVYQPVRMFTYSNANADELSNWVDSAVLGRVSDKGQVIRFDWTSISTTKFCSLAGASFEPCVFERAVLAAYNNDRKNIYLVLRNVNETDFFSTISRYSSLLKYVDEFVSSKHGWSENELEDPSFYQFLIGNSLNARRVLNRNKVQLPSNLHIVGSIIMSNANDMEFDYKFQRCLVDTGNDTPNATETKTELPVLYPRETNTVVPMNFILYGAPGTGKTYATAEYAMAIIERRKVDLTQKTPAERLELMKKYKEAIQNGRITFTTFHQSYGYEDFIQGLRPDTQSGGFNFVPVDGVFKRIADEAIKHGDKDYVIIIDEINRANISKVFGELITLIEVDKRWGEINALSVTLPSGQAFAVPNNLFIVGTMNSADKSISLIDAALRRRFDFIEVVPNAKIVENTVLKTVLERLNEELFKELDSTDLLVGHAYFMGKDENDLCAIMNQSIIPLLYEYFYDNSNKVKNILEKAIAGYNFKVTPAKVGRLRLTVKD
jgi:hypothetical protein